MSLLVKTLFNFLRKVPKIHFVTINQIKLSCLISKGSCQWWKLDMHSKLSDENHATTFTGPSSSTPTTVWNDTQCCYKVNFLKRNKNCNCKMVFTRFFTYKRTPNHYLSFYGYVTVKAHLEKSESFRQPVK